MKNMKKACGYESMRLFHVSQVETHGELWYNHLVHLLWKIRRNKAKVNPVHLANGGKR